MRRLASATYRQSVRSLTGFSLSHGASPEACFSAAYRRTSWNSAPSRRMRRTSSTRCRTVAFVGLLMGAHQGVNPTGVPVVDGVVVGQGELLPVAVGAQVSAALQAEPPAVRRGEGDNLRVGPRRR